VILVNGARTGRWAFDRWSRGAAAPWNSGKWNMSGPWNSLMSDPSHSWRSDLVIDRGKSMDNFSLEEMAEKLGELMRPIFWIWGPKIVAAVIFVECTGGESTAARHEPGN